MLEAAYIVRPVHDWDRVGSSWIDLKIGEATALARDCYSGNVVADHSAVKKRRYIRQEKQLVQHVHNWYYMSSRRVYTSPANAGR